MNETHATIRPAVEHDLASLPVIEVAAGRLFAEAGLQSIADDDPPTPEDLRAHLIDGTIWVATDERDRPIGYATASIVDGEGHLDQVSVLPSAGGRGVGTALVVTVERWARDRCLGAVTLTTFAHLPWNGPWYRQLGFAPLADEEMGPELAGIRAVEKARGIDVAPRLAMRKMLSTRLRSPISRPLDEPHPSRLAPDAPGRDEILRHHRAALDAGDAGYCDPTSGLFVFTAQHHLDCGSCCESGCRHCPYV